MDPDMNEPKRIQTTRRVVLVRPHRTRRDGWQQSVVWKQRRRAFVISAVGWLVLAVVGAIRGFGASFVILSLAACVLSVAVVIKAHLLLQRVEQAPPSA
jgi:hypothetical protein